MDTQLSLGEELDYYADNDFGSFIQMGNLLLESAGMARGSLNLTSCVGPEGELPTKPGGGSLFDHVCSLLEKKCDFWKGEMWKGKEQKVVIKTWNECNTNAFLGEKLREVAILRKKQGDEYSSRAHATAARLIATSKIRIKSGQEAQKIKGIGVKIAAKIDELLETHTLEILEKEQEVDQVMNLFMEIWGVGVATARFWYDRGLRSYEDLEMEVRKGDISLTKLQKYWMRHQKDFPQSMERDEMRQIGLLVEAAARFVAPTSETIVVGSYRRGKKSSKDVDILVLVDAMDDPHRDLSTAIVCARVAQKLATLCELEVVCSGEHVFMGGIRLPGMTKSGSKAIPTLKLWRRLDVYVALKDEAACGLLAHTGPWNYNQAMRAAAQAKGWRLNEYHLYDERGDVIPTESEADVQRLLEFEVLSPEERF